ncbi:hypothetical protein ElyMa_001862500 [Elysia marginata]|uniref:Uncharacterized protein n=1 Tax=Elysia marginata TaxID=1093978 RepID=A0AAV4EM18_9GAST|nr:hypothetical protein ElyMa_001862500 [Elysia marginata]
MKELPRVDVPKISCLLGSSQYARCGELDCASIIPPGKDRREWEPSQHAIIDYLLCGLRTHIRNIKASELLGTFLWFLCLRMSFRIVVVVVVVVVVAAAAAGKVGG